MAIDNTPPKLKLIVTIGVIVVVTLVGLDFVFRGYLSYMNDMAAREKIAPLKDLEAQHASEKAAFARAKLPIGAAMAQVAQGMRDPSIAPQPSDDTGAMSGWTKLPKPVPTPQPMGFGIAPALEAASVDAGASLEGGAPSASDAGAEGAKGHGLSDAHTDAGAAPGHGGH